MKVVNQSYEILKQKDVSKHIERIGRVCYKSENRITDDGESAIKFVKMLINHNHGAMLEHSNLAFIIPSELYSEMESYFRLNTELCVKDKTGEIVSPSHAVVEYSETPYLRFTKVVDLSGEAIRCVVSGNIRSWLTWLTSFKGPYCRNIAKVVNNSLQGVVAIPLVIDNVENSDATAELIEDYSILSPNERSIHETISVMFVTDRGVSHELVRHRPASFAQESTRYVRYNNENKEGSELSFVDIQPGLKIEANSKTDINKVLDEWRAAMEDAEKHYNAMLEYGASPQMARSVLPNSTRTSITITANLREWHHILSLRACDSTGPAHPQMKEAMEGVLQDFKQAYPDIFGDLN